MHRSGVLLLRAFMQHQAPAALAAAAAAASASITTSTAWPPPPPPALAPLPPPAVHEQQQQQQPALLGSSSGGPCSIQQQQQRGYHRAQHAGRMLSSQLLRQQTWQDLRQAFDASRSRLNPASLSVLAAQLAKLAPPPGTLLMAEQQQLQAFLSEVGNACGSRLRKFDAVGLATALLALSRLGDIAARSGDVQTFLQTSAALQAACERAGEADGRTLGMLLSAVTMLLQQQQPEQQRPDSMQPEQQPEQPDQQQQQQLAAVVQLVTLIRGRALQLGSRLKPAQAVGLALAAGKLAATVNLRPSAEQDSTMAPGVRACMPAVARMMCCPNRARSSGWRAGSVRLRCRSFCRRLVGTGPQASYMAEVEPAAAPGTQGAAASLGSGCVAAVASRRVVRHFARTQPGDAQQQQCAFWLLPHRHLACAARSPSFAADGSRHGSQTADSSSSMGMKRLLLYVMELLRQLWAGQQQQQQGQQQQQQQGQQAQLPTLREILPAFQLVVYDGEIEQAVFWKCCGQDLLCAIKDAAASGDLPALQQLLIHRAEQMLDYMLLAFEAYMGCLVICVSASLEWPKAALADLNGRGAGSLGELLRRGAAVSDQHLLEHQTRKALSAWALRSALQCSRLHERLGGRVAVVGMEAQCDTAMFFWALRTSRQLDVPLAETLLVTCDSDGIASGVGCPLALIDNRDRWRLPLRGLCTPATILPAMGVGPQGVWTEADGGDYSSVPGLGQQTLGPLLRPGADQRTWTVAEMQQQMQSSVPHLSAEPGQLLFMVWGSGSSLLFACRAVEVLPQPLLDAVRLQRLDRADPSVQSAVDASGRCLAMAVDAARQAAAETASAVERTEDGAAAAVELMEVDGAAAAVELMEVDGDGYAGSVVSQLPPDRWYCALTDALDAGQARERRDCFRDCFRVRQDNTGAVAPLSRDVGMQIRRVEAFLALDAPIRVLQMQHVLDSACKVLARQPAPAPAGVAVTRSRVVAGQRAAAAALAALQQ